MEESVMVQSSQQELSKKALGLNRLTQPSTSTVQRGYSIAGFCAVYGICRSLAYVEIREGRLKARKAGRRTLIAAEDAELWFSNLARVKAA
jgi:hypothetical protein